MSVYLPHNLVYLISAVVSVPNPLLHPPSSPLHLKGYLLRCDLPRDSDDTDDIQPAPKVDVDHADAAVDTSETGTNHNTPQYTLKLISLFSIVCCSQIRMFANFYTLTAYNGSEAQVWLSRQDPTALDHTVKYRSMCSTLGRRYVAMSQVRKAGQMVAVHIHELAVRHYECVCVCT